MKSIIKETLLYGWQLPQNLLGLALRAYYKGNDKLGQDYVSKRISTGLAADTLVRVSSKMKGGISLGKYIIVTPASPSLTIAHEMGHAKQSKLLGPLYLLIVGIPSAMHASIAIPNTTRYYKFFTEKWADKLAGITRN